MTVKAIRSSCLRNAENLAESVTEKDINLVSVVEYQGEGGQISSTVCRSKVQFEVVLLSRMPFI